jgi:hypothetical protein
MFDIPNLLVWAFGLELIAAPEFEKILARLESSVFDQSYKKEDLFGILQREWLISALFMLFKHNGSICSKEQLPSWFRTTNRRAYLFPGQSGIPGQCECSGSGAGISLFAVRSFRLRRRWLGKNYSGLLLESNALFFIGTRWSWGPTHPTKKKHQNKNKKKKRTISFNYHRIYES